jgi:hypothetical protein
MAEPPAVIQGKWVGTLEQYSHDTHGSFAMVMTIDEVSGNEFRGTIDWPDNDNNRTAMRGYLENGRVFWTETGYLRGRDVVLDGLYVATLSEPTTLSGDWMDPKYVIHPAGPRYGTPGASFVLHKQ